jgi:hypothetical protein
VAFHADCYPSPDDDLELPAPADVTAWTLAFINDAQALHFALAEVADMVPAPLDAFAQSMNGDLGQGIFAGPDGKGAEVSWTVTFALSVTRLP